MPRIRSIHPGLFTDENYAVLSFPARELLKGLWIESDDNGIFEWKPLSLKMRIFPADQVDVSALLEELTDNWIRPFDEAGKRYGACKNFCKYQRPKKPKTVHPLPEGQKAYVRHGYKARAAEHSDDERDEVETNSPPVPHQLPTGTEMSGQMEDGGGRREDGLTDEAKASSAAGAAIIDFPATDKPAWWPKRDRYGRVLGEITDKLLFDVGKAVLGKSSGGLISRLKNCECYRRNWRSAMDLLMQADEKSEPLPWFTQSLRRAEVDEPVMPMHEKFPEREYRA